MLATMMTKRSLVWLFGVITVGLLAGVVVGRMPGLSEASAEATVSDRPADETIQYVLDAGVLGEAHIYVLDWSTDGNLWLFGSQSDGKVILSRYEPGSGALTQWTLPDSASPGPHTYLEEQADGSWWIAANYTIWSFDPEAEAATVHEVLELDHPCANDAALDRHSPLPGTWINGFVIALDGTTVFTRNNVEATFSLGADGTIELREELPYAPVGLINLDGAALAYESTTALLEAVGNPGGVVDGSGVAVAVGTNCTATFDPASSKGYLETDSTERTLSEITVQAGDQVTIASDGQTVVAALSEEAVILRGACNDEEWESFELAVHMVDPRDDPVRGGSLWDRVDRAAVPMKSTIVGLAIGPAGQVAFSDDAMRVGIID